MPSARVRDIPGFSIDRVAAAAGEDPAVLRLENLDTDLRPPAAALAATRLAIDSDDANSYLPFTGTDELRRAAAAHVSRLSGVPYDPAGQCVITAGGTAGMFNVLLAVLDPGDEVILTDPTYAGMIHRVRLAGAMPRLVPLLRAGRGWALDLDALGAAVSPRTRMLFLMNPSMPSGAVLSRGEWEHVAGLCVRHGLRLLYNAAMERILYDGRAYLHPAALPGMAERTITVGSVSKEYRMIGWRVGWVVGPADIMPDIAKVGIYNVVTPVGIAQGAAAAALTTPDDGVAQAVAEWERRRDLVHAELEGLPLVAAAGGWSMLLDVAELGLDSFTASERLLVRGRIAATPMRHWGEVNGERFIRLVFSNEPVQRLAGMGRRVRESLGVGA
ncbi:MAG: pyridoxal phosphate-dependent aminotransferase [Gemmatimonadales bacterium]